MPQDRNRTHTGEKLPQIRSNVLVALGSNHIAGIDDAREAVKKALLTIQSDLGVIRFKSRFFKTPAFPAGIGPDFVNAALSLESELSAHEVLARLHAIEARTGRTRDVRWGPRNLDLDLIAMDDQVFPDPQTHKIWRDLPLDAQMAQAPEQLILPHPRLHERAFVLIPLADVAPDWCHPLLNKTVREMILDLPQEAKNEVQVLQ